MSGFYNSPSQGVDDYPSLSTPVQRGTSPLECWYSGVANQTAYAAGTGPLNEWHSYPVIIGRSGYIDRIAFEVTANVANAVARAGIYRATSKFNIYPGALVVDSGEFDCGTAAGIKSATINTFLQAGLYWFCLRFGVATSTYRAMAAGAQNSLAGVASTIGANPSNRLLLSSTYAAFPDPFTAGATLSVAPPRLVHVRFA